MTSEARIETQAFDATGPRSRCGAIRFRSTSTSRYKAPPPPWEEATRAGVQSGAERMIAESRPNMLTVREGWVPY